MSRLLIALSIILLSTPAWAASTKAPKELNDLFFGEALYYAFQDDWFDAISRLDTELRQFRTLDEPELDPFSRHADQADFAVGDFELAYRMHHRAGRAITAVIEGNVDDATRNEALYRLAKIYYQKDQPQLALRALERVGGEIPEAIRDDLAFLRAQVLTVNGRIDEAIELFDALKGEPRLGGFAGYNLGMALILNDDEKGGRRQLDETGLLQSDDPMIEAIRDKANLVLGEKLLSGDDYLNAGLVLDRVRLTGPLSNRALLGSGWAAASLENYRRALVPWSLLADREVTDAAVQEALLAVPYSYGKLGVYSKAALLYGRALEIFSDQIERLSDSITSIREGKFLRALVREELKQDANWVVRLRELPESPETYYLLDLMASHDFQESLRNYIDLEELRKRLTSWRHDLDAYAEMIELRRRYYEPLLPEIDQSFRRLDSQMRLRLEQRENIDKRLRAMLVAPRPDFLATAEERVEREALQRLEEAMKGAGTGVSAALRDRLGRLKGLVFWNIHTDYERRLGVTYDNLHALDGAVDALKEQYNAFVRVRQAATQSYQGYSEPLEALRRRIDEALERVNTAMTQQGHLIEVMAERELQGRRERLEDFQVKARFAMADSYDRALRMRQGEEPDHE